MQSTCSLKLFVYQSRCIMVFCLKYVLCGLQAKIRLLSSSCGLVCITVQRLATQTCLKYSECIKYLHKPAQTVFFFNIVQGILKNSFSQIHRSAVFGYRTSVQTFPNRHESESTNVFKQTCLRVPMLSVYAHFQNWHWRMFPLCLSGLQTVCIKTISTSFNISSSVR